MNLKQEIETFIRARYPILYIVSGKEACEQSLGAACAERLNSPGAAQKDEGAKCFYKVLLPLFSCQH